MIQCDYDKVKKLVYCLKIKEKKALVKLCVQRLYSLIILLDGEPIYVMNTGLLVKMFTYMPFYWGIVFK